MPPPPPALPPQLSLLLDSGPPALLDFLRMAQRTLASALPQLERFVLRQIEGLAADEAPPMLTAERISGVIGPLKVVVARFGPVLEQAQPLRGLAALLPLEELFLLAKTLMQREKDGTLTPTEAMAVTAFKDLRAMLGIDATAPAGESAVATAAADHVNTSSGEGTTPAGVPYALPAYGRADGAAAGGAGGASSSTASLPGIASARHEQQRTDAIEALLRGVIAVKPELGRPNALERAGFPPRAVSVVYSQLDGVGDVVAVSHALARKLDDQAIEELRAALALVTARGSPSLSYDGPRGILDEGSGWNMAAKAVLGAPQVTFTTSAQTMAAFVGLAPVMKLWREAQNERSAKDRSPNPAEGREGRTTTQLLSHGAAEQVSTAYQKLRERSFKVCVTVDSSARYAPLQRVTEVRRATYREERAAENAWVEDCTAEARTALLEGEGASGRRYSLHLHGPRIDQLLRALDVVPRNPSAPQRGYKFGDLTRRTFRAVDGLVEHALEGSTRRSLVIEFSQSLEVSAEHEPAEYLPRVQALVNSLDDHGALRSLHRDDGEFTWFKLNEWMQVEIIEAFGASLSHAAWYRFVRQARPQTCSGPRSAPPRPLLAPPCVSGALGSRNSF